MIVEELRAAEPFWLETPAGPAFAWHHAPAGAARQAAVLLCRPFGYEAQASQRAYRHLAVELAGAGFHVVRFDYQGTGDSSGGDTDDARWTAWIATVQSAADWVRSALGIERVVLFGTRLGALVAAASAKPSRADALVLFAPPQTGRAWLREARAIQAMIDAPKPPSSAPPGEEQSAGFVIVSATAAAIAAFDLASLGPLAPAALVVARDDLPGNEDRFVAAQRAGGVAVTTSQTEGYAAMVHSDPRRAVTPRAVWAEVTAWLSARYPDPGRDARAPAYRRAAQVRETRKSAPVREEALDVDGLFGVLTEPVGPGACGELPTIVLLNVGVNSHIGPHRVYVTMSRRWAERGFRVLRLDTTGLGDSPATATAPENRTYSQEAIADAGRAMDALGRIRGATRFILAGLCSGGHVSFHAAQAAPRVAGIILLNIVHFHWKEGDSLEVPRRDSVKAARFYRHALLGKDAWIRLVRGRVNLTAIAQGLAHKGWVHALQHVNRAIVGESDVARGFRRLLRRGTDVLLVFSEYDGGRDAVDAHLGDDAERFRREPGFRFEVMEGTDHTFSPAASRELLLALLTNHLVSRFAESTRVALRCAPRASGENGPVHSVAPPGE
jgi:pimeloyl-ACP methyl ester carboxylesterase